MSVIQLDGNLQFQNVTAFNHNFKAALALGVKATEKIWTLAQTLEKKWQAGEIKGGKKGMK